MKATDKRVKDLWDVVLKKKAEIQEAEKPNWKTNCTFSYTKDTSSPHQRLNIQTITDLDEFVDALAFLGLRQESCRVAAESLGIAGYTFKWQGFTVEAWKSDFSTRINKIKINEKKKELAAFETRLEALLSPELKAELELNEIVRLLGEDS